MSEARMDYVAFRDGQAYALMSADDTTALDLQEFREENPGAEIRLMPVAEAVEAHVRYLSRRLDMRMALQGGTHEP